jgi:hypothetical protein
MPFKLKKNDTSPILQTTITDAANNAVDLTGSSVRFHMKRYGASTAKVDAAATIYDEENGIVRYAWQSSDTDTGGSFIGEFEVTYSDGTIETFPNSGYIQIDVLDDIT